MPSDTYVLLPEPSPAAKSSRCWARIDSTGKSTVVDIDKHAIMQRVQINGRDLRILDPNLSYPSTILGREKAIVLNLEHIKVIITAKEVLLRNPLDDNVVSVAEELQRRLPGDAGDEDESPFEFIALEVALEAICSFLDAQATELETTASPVLKALTSKISARNLDKIRKLKSTMTRLIARVQKVRDEIAQLLDDDDDMADIYLSRKLACASSSVSNSGENDVEELEMLLEAYFMQTESTLNRLNTLREYIDDTEDYINIQLDNHRNRLIQVELVLNALTVALSVYSLVGAVFGMNIPYTWNAGHGYIFKWVLIGSGMFCAVLFGMIMSYARFKGLI